MNTSEHINELAAALAKAQGELQNPSKDKVNPHFKNRYADIASGLDAVRPVLSKHGLSVVQITSTDGDSVMLHTRLLHGSGQWLESLYPVCKIAPHQQMGAALTYARRYALFALVGVAGDDDDDGNSAAEPKPTQNAVKSVPVTPSPGKREKMEYVDRQIAEIRDCATDAEVHDLWEVEAKNRQLHFTSKSDPDYVRLKAAMADHLDAIALQRDAAE